MLIEKLKERLGTAIVDAESARDEEMIVIGRDSVPEVMRRLRDEADFAFDFLADLTAVDWLERNPRFDVVYQLRSFSHGTALRVKVGIDGAEPWTHSVAGLWKSADWLERECFDMFGIRFDGHPDLRRILMFDSFEGHPLRKDYPYNRRQVLVEEVDPVTHPRRPSR